MARAILPGREKPGLRTRDFTRNSEREFEQVRPSRSASKRVDHRTVSSTRPRGPASKWRYQTVRASLRKILSKTGRKLSIMRYRKISRPALCKNSSTGRYRGSHAEALPTSNARPSPPGGAAFFFAQWRAGRRLPWGFPRTSECAPSFLSSSRSSSLRLLLRGRGAPAVSR